MLTDVCISFDTTGSMSPCIAEVRRRVTDTIETLFSEIEGLRISIVSHGDYCDGGESFYAVDFTDNIKKLVNFVRDVPNTNGGDGDEFYEYVLHRIGELDWKGDNRALIMIGDAHPHPVGYTYNNVRYSWDWREEANRLVERGISIYAVEALGDRNRRTFYEPLAHMSNGRWLALNQFADAVETIIAISYHATGDEVKLESYRNELKFQFKMNRNLAAVFNALGTDVIMGEDHSGLVPVEPHRFQVLHVDHNTDIKSFVLATGATFKKGKGFYQFTKPETIQEYKEVVLRNKYTGDMFTGSEAREFIGLPFGERGDIRPGSFDQYEVYVQSTSVNRKLIGGTKFLYENSYS